ncbi:MAG: LptE family protein [Ignavibacteria bacterium]
MVFIYGCSYSFTGASIPSHLKTIAIPISIDRSGSGEAELSENFTNELINKFVQDNSLQIGERSNSDALLECTILSLTDSPQVVSQGEDVTLRRVKITIKVTYKDLVKKKTILDKNFSNYSDYSNSNDVTEDRLTAIETAIDNITEDILLSVVSNW